MIYAHYVLTHNELCVAYIRFSETKTETATVHKLHQCMEDLHIMKVSIIRITQHVMPISEH